MRGKRSKQYRKLMHRYETAFEFRPAYQVLVDAELVKDAHSFKMDLPHLLKRTLHNDVKIMITQCSMRHIYTSKNSSLIDLAKNYERRRCNHHELENPLSTLKCLSSVVDPKSDSTNKHRYVIASQDPDVRSHFRQIPGVPLIYISRSVMILEPISEATESFVTGEERRKFRVGLKPKVRASVLGKRPRDEEDGVEAKGGDVAQKKKHKKGPKGPNPLSILKPRKRNVEKRRHDAANGTITGAKDQESRDENTSPIPPEKKKRKRKPSKLSGGEVQAANETD